jgi:phage-related protein
MSEDRVDAIEKRLAKVEGDLAALHSTVLKKLTEAMQLIQRYQKMRDTRVNEQLRQIVQELTHIREKLANQVPPVMN